MKSILNTRYYQFFYVKTFQLILFNYFFHLKIFTLQFARKIILLHIKNQDLESELIHWHYQNNNFCQFLKIMFLLQ